MKKLLAFVVCLFAFAGVSAAEEASFEPLYLQMMITYPDMQGTTRVQGISKSLCNAVLYDARGYFAIKKDSPCVKAFENAQEAGAYDNIGFAIPDPDLPEEPFFYDSDYIEQDRVQDAGEYYTFYISPEFINTNTERRRALKAELKRLLEPFGGALSNEQIIKALAKTPKPAEDKGFRSNAY